MEIRGYSGLKRLARGGYATVYRGTEVATGRTVAIKVLDRIGPKEERRFSREFQTLDHLTGHPNVLAVHELIRNDEGAPCLVLEYMPGGSLVDLLDEYPQGIDESDAAYLADNVLAALVAAHEAGVLHRDIKPSNVLLGNGHIKLADFGIAKFTDSTATTSTAISTTVLFAAPEVIMARGITEQSDLYSLGATIYSLLAGRPPHSSVAEALATAAASKSVDASLPDVSEGFASWVARLLSADPAERPASAAEARRALQAFVPDAPSAPLARTISLGSTEPGRAIDPPTALQTTRIHPPEEREATAEQKPIPVAWIGAGVAALAALIAVPLLLFGGGEEPDTALPPVSTTTASVPPTTIPVPTTGVPPATDASGGGVVVPDLSLGSDPEAALSALGLEAMIVMSNDDIVPAGGVISQDPAAGTRVAPGTTVTVVVSGGPELVTVPDVLAHPDPAAALMAAGFDVTETSEYSNDVPVGGVITTRPGAGVGAAAGSTVQLVLSLGPSVIISVVDDSDTITGRYTDVAIGVDGFGIISYFSNGTVRTAHCSNRLCSEATVSIIDEASSFGPVGPGAGGTAVAIGGDGLPLVVYGDDSDATVWAAHCNNRECSSSTRVFLESRASGLVDAVTLPSGLVAFTYNKLPTSFDLTPGAIDLGSEETDVTVAVCTNADCTGATRNVVRTVPFETFGLATYIPAEKNSITVIGSGMLEVLINLVDDLQIAVCTVGDCSQRVLVDPRIDGLARGAVTSFTAGFDGIGLFTYEDASDNELYVGHCADGDCFGSTRTRVPWDSAFFGQTSAVTLGSDGLAVIAFYDGENGDLVVAHCENILCTEMSVRAIDTGGDVGSHVSIAAAQDGTVLISYYDATNQRLKVAACLKPDCS